MSDIRVRFAPSPTGHLHIGGARTALFNWLFARHTGGRFVLRIEDTDTTRSTDEYIESIMEGLKWLGLDWDEGPFRQTERTGLHVAAVNKLLENGNAYYCYCSPEELEARRQEAQKSGKPLRYDRRCRERKEPIEGIKPTVRFAMPLEGTLVINDMIKGGVTFNNEELDDLIIMRSDGTPTYNLVVVEDDVDMGITHVIRGDDHLNNTPKQAHIYRALGHEMPTFAHLPMILGSDKARLSKRHGATSVIAYRDEGYLADALINYLVRLGWSHGDQEVFSREELIEFFSFDSVGRSAAVFNPEKLLWLNAEYIKTTPPEKLAELVKPFLIIDGTVSDDWSPERAWLAKAIGTLIERAKDLKELAVALRYYILETVEFEDKARKKFLKPETGELLEEARSAIEKMDDFNAAALEDMFKAICERRELGLGKLAQPVRVAVTGGTASPGIFDVLEIVGRERTLLRLQKAISATEG